MTAPMHEQATLEKLRRAALAPFARFAPAPLLGALARTPAEKAAVALRKARTSTQTATPVTTFAIPLVGKHQVSDWSVIEDTLARALRALIAQSDPNWRVVICSQDVPDAVALDPRITAIRFTQKVEGHDKTAKLAQLAQHCLKEMPQAGFFMPMDGDDLLHRDFLRDLHSTQDSGLLVSSGYILDAGAHALGYTAARSWGALQQKPFWKFCGSCMALPTGTAPAEEADFFAALAQHEHRLYPHLAHMAGIRLRRTTEPRALYIINHGENFETRRGRGGFKQRFVQKFKVTDPDTLAALDEVFPGSGALL